MNAIPPPRNRALPKRHSEPRLPRPPAVPGTRERKEDAALLQGLSGGIVCALLILIYWYASVR